MVTRALDKFARSTDAWARRKISVEYDTPHLGFVGHNIAQIARDKGADIAQLHWLGGNFLKLSSLRGLTIPVVWRLPDMLAFCAVEMYEARREQYVSHTTRPDAKSVIDVRKLVFRMKASTYARINLTIVTPSRWLAREAECSELLGDKEIVVIPSGCDSDNFGLRDKKFSRSELGLPGDRPIVLFGADSLETRRKGIDLFEFAMMEVHLREWSVRPLIVTFGSGSLPTSIKTLFECREYGRIDSREGLAILYNAADVFVAPSRMENLANTVLEALACGTPTVAFDIGGMPDMIEHEVNGWLAPPFDTANLADGIAWAISKRGDEGVRAAARKKILAQFSLEQEIDKYIALYERLLGKTKAEVRGDAR